MRPGMNKMNRAAQWPMSLRSGIHSHVPGTLRTPRRTATAPRQYRWRFRPCGHAPPNGWLAGPSLSRKRCSDLTARGRIGARRDQRGSTRSSSRTSGEGIPARYGRGSGLRPGDMLKVGELHFQCQRAAAGVLALYARRRLGTETMKAACRKRGDKGGAIGGALGGAAPRTGRQVCSGPMGPWPETCCSRRRRWP